MIIQSILLFADTHPEVIEPSISIVTIIGAIFSFIASVSMIIFSVWLKSSSDRKYAEQQKEEGKREESFESLKKQVYANKENILTNTIHDENNIKENSRMQKSIEEMRKSVDGLAKEVHDLAKIVAGLKNGG